MLTDFQLNSCQFICKILSHLIKLDITTGKTVNPSQQIQIPTDNNNSRKKKFPRHCT